MSECDGYDFDPLEDTPDWIDKQGNKYLMADIGDSHLLNIIKLLKRRQFAAMNEGYSSLSILQGEMAIDAAESEIEMEQSRYQDMIDKFTCVALDRGLLK